MCYCADNICAHPADCQNRVADVEATVTISIGPTAWCIGRMAIFVAAKLCEIRIILFTPQPSGHHGIVVTRDDGRQGGQSLVNALTSVNLHGSFSNLARTFVAPDLGRVWFASLSWSRMHNAFNEPINIWWNHYGRYEHEIYFLFAQINIVFRYRPKIICFVLRTYRQTLSSDLYEWRHMAIWECSSSEVWIVDINLKPDQRILSGALWIQVKIKSLIISKAI